MKFHLAISFLFFCPVALAEEPTFRSWETTDGKSAEAAFHSLDEQAGTVTILVPKVISLDRLSEASRQQAFKLRNAKVTEVKKEPATEERPKSDPQYLMTGGLDNPTITEWNNASDNDKWCTCGNMVFAMLANNLASRPVRTVISTPKGVNQMTAELYLSVEFTLMKLKTDGMAFDPDKLTVTEILGSFAANRGWLKSNSQNIEGVLFTDLRFVPDGDRFKLIGRAKNTTNQDIQMGTYHLDFEKHGQLETVHSLLIPGLKAGEEKSFSAALFKISAAPKIEDMTIIPFAVVSLPDP